MYSLEAQKIFTKCSVVFFIFKSYMTLEEMLVDFASSAMFSFGVVCLGSGFLEWLNK
jgi:hypothetical protein